MSNEMFMNGEAGPIGAASLEMTLSRLLNDRSEYTAAKVKAKGFHEDDEFMQELADKLAGFAIDGYVSPEDRQKFLDIWNRNRKLARIALIHSELSEAVEGIRKDLMDDKLPHRKMEEVEMADTLIRMFDYAGVYGLDLGGAESEKQTMNEGRPYKHGKLV